jgi:xanthine/uracil permease
MSRATVLQIIAAAIAIAVMAALHQFLGDFLHSLDPKFLQGLAVGAIGMMAVCLVLFWAEQRRLATLARRKQQSTRDIIDL